MNEQRLEAYLSLIHTLLNCSDEKVIEILREHEQLVDEGLIVVMMQVIKQIAEAGDEDTAHWLLDLAQQLAMSLGKPLTIITPEDSFIFLLQLFQKISKNSSFQYIYPFLKENFNLINENLGIILTNLFTLDLPKLNSEEAQHYTALISNFSHLISEFPLGNIAVNKEIAIIGYQIALTYFTYDAFPDRWATIQTYLGAAYLYRIKGERAENIELAIKCYKKARKLFKFKDFRREWATIQTNLAAAYCNRIIGDKVSNIRKAISFCQKAFLVYTETAFPQEWADTQITLAVCYRVRMEGDREENLKQSILAYQQAWRFYNEEKALNPNTEETFRQQWAMIQNNLANLYQSKADISKNKKDKDKNIELAISAYKNALTIRTIEAYPQKWATTHINLGNVLCKSGNLHKAIEAYENASSIFSFEAFPEHWAALQLNQASVYKQFEENKEENLKAAIFFYQQASKVFTFKSFPQQWAMIYHNLGLVYQALSRVNIINKTENLNLAIAAFQQALQIHKPKTFPHECLPTGDNLGNSAFAAKKWEIAIQGYDIAIEAIEVIYAQGADDARRQEILSDAIDVYHKIVQTYINLGQLDKALEYVERSKARNLVELFSIQDLQPRGNIPESILKEFNRLRRAVTAEKRQLAMKGSIRNRNQLLEDLLSEDYLNQLPSIICDRTQINKLQKQLNDFIDCDITPIDPSFKLTQKVAPISFSEIQTLTDERTVIIEWYIVASDNNIKGKIITFIITHHSSQPIVLQSPEEDLQVLAEATTTYLSLYKKDLHKWRDQLFFFFQNFAKILYIEEIVSHIPVKCDSLILVPHYFLHLLPLHALPINNSGTTLVDKFKGGVRYAPSCQILKFAQNKKYSNLQNLFAIQNPTNDLLYSNIEVEVIRSFFPTTQVLAKQAATKTAIKTEQNLVSANCIHFSCHGFFDPVSSLESALSLANNEKLTLEEILEFSLSKCCLVTLSACETGLSDFSSFNDEYIGLPSCFLLAGSSTVVSSLWVVSDLSTALLMVKFYKNLFSFAINKKTVEDKEIPVSVALNQAQQWMRNLTCQELEQEITKYQQIIAKLQQTLSSVEFFELEDAIESQRKKLQQFAPNDKPFVNPYYWAAFVATGV
jgi:CHAT domain-containing protein